MSKLLGLKQWLTVPDAAKRLSIMFGEEVTEADVLRLALDGHLTLSVYFVNGTTASGPGKDEQVVSLSGVWDLLMVGGELRELEHRYQMLTGGPDVKADWGKPYVCREDSSASYELVTRKEAPENSVWYHPENYYPAEGLPPDSVLVVRISEFQELETRLAQPKQSQQKPVGTRERTTFLVLIAALAKMPKIDIGKSSSAALAIESQTALMGARVAARTIEGHLKAARGFIESRSEG